MVIEKALGVKTTLHGVSTSKSWPCHSEGAFCATEEFRIFKIETLTSTCSAGASVAFAQGDIFETTYSFMTGLSLFKTP